MFPKVKEEIFVVSEQTRTLLNYVSIVEFSNISLINMLNGPMTNSHREDNDMDEEGYKSQEIFT